MVICLEQGEGLHMAQLMPLPLTVSCFSKIQIGFTFLVPAHLVVPEKRPLSVCVCVCVCVMVTLELGPGSRDRRLGAHVNRRCATGRVYLVSQVIQSEGV